PLRTGAVVLQERSVALAPRGSRDPAAERNFGRALHAVRTGTVLLQGGAVPGAKDLRPYSTLGCSRRRMFSSRSALASTAPGAWVMTQAALWVFGKALTSGIELAPVTSITRRSRPQARPPCGRTSS